MRKWPEWVGRTDDTRIPERVMDRVSRRYGDRCQGPCGQQLGGKLRAQMDHIVALANGGCHREGNLQPLCRPCHQIKTGLDVQAKAVTARVRKKHLGIKRRSRFAEMYAWKKMILAERARKEEEKLPQHTLDALAQFENRKEEEE